MRLRGQVAGGCSLLQLFLRQVMRHEQVCILQQKARQHAQLESERWKMRDYFTSGCGLDLSHSGDDKRCGSSERDAGVSRRDNASDTVLDWLRAINGDYHHVGLF